MQAQRMALKLEILEDQEDEHKLMAAEANATLTATKAPFRQSATLEEVRNLTYVRTYYVRTYVRT